MMNQQVIVTGSAGFIGFHLCKQLLIQGIDVIGVDCMTNYYDVELKKNRLAQPSDLMDHMRTLDFRKLQHKSRDDVRSKSKSFIKNVCDKD